MGTTQGLAVREGSQPTGSLDHGTHGNESHGGRGVLVYGSVGAWTLIFSFLLCVPLVAFLLQFRLGLRFIGDLRQYLRRWAERGEKRERQKSPGANRMTPGMPADTVSRRDVHCVKLPRLANGLRQKRVA